MRTLLRDTRMRMAESSARSAQLIEEALRRLGRGDNGLCVDSGGPNEVKRLEIVPWATRCVEDQEAAEFEARDRSPSL
jgi:RNA polymerase-binding transcription factor DksA